MPGFVGVYSDLGVDPETVEQAAQETKYSAHTVIGNVYTDQRFVIRKSYVNFLEVPGTGAQQNDVQLWIEGEVYNHQTFHSNPDQTLAETLLQGYLENKLDSLLPKINGVFVIVIYDLREQQIILITDRYGLKPFYLYAKNRSFIFAPELKCFPFLKAFEMEIRKDVVDCFIQLEHLMGDATWFKGVEVTVPSTVYTYSLTQHSLTKRRYWSWSQIKRSAISLDEAAEQIGYLLNQAIKKRNFGNYRVGLGLSGGYDSRAILAATYKNKPTTYTFGISSSDDVKIANRVAAMAGVKNIHYDMAVDNWIEKRFSGVWKTDGMMNMYHMHYSHIMDELPKVLDVNLSGFLGDGMLGQTYLVKKGKTFPNKRINESIAQHYYGKYWEFSDPNDPFFDIEKVDVYLVYNRGRRLTGLGLEEPNKTLPQRIPFMDIDLLDFSYSLPDEYRMGNKAYHRALLRMYPDFFKNIPHATSGVPISLNPSFIQQAKKKFRYGMYAVKYKLGIATSYTDVYNWIKVPQTAAQIGDMLDPAKALYAEFTNRNFKQEFLEPHVQGKKNHMKQVMGALTLEVWLQQLLNKKYRKG